MIRNNVKKIRESKGVTMTHMANILGMTIQGYRHLENGGSRIDAERLKIIAKVLNVDVAIFFEDELTDYVISEMEREIGKSISTA